MRARVKEPFCFEADCGFSFVPTNVPVVIQAQREGSTGGNVPLVIEPSAPGYQDLQDEFDNVYLPTILPRRPTGGAPLLSPPRRSPPVGLPIASVLPVVAAIPAPAAAALQTGEELLASLLEAPLRPPVAVSELEALLQKPLIEPMTDLGRLLLQEFVPKGGTISATGASEAGFLSRLLGVAGDLLSPLALALYSPDLGPSAAEEAARVAANLPPPPPGGYPRATDANPLPEPVGLPVALPGAAGPLETTFPIDTVTVTAPRIPTFVPDVQLQPFGYFQPSPGGFALPGVEPSPQPAPRGAASPAPRTAPVPQLSGLTLPSTTFQPLASPGASPGTSPGAKPGPLNYPTQQTERCPQPGKQKKKQQKRKPRTVCHTGTYIEFAKGTTKHPKRIIQCR